MAKPNITRKTYSLRAQGRLEELDVIYSNTINGVLEKEPNGFRFEAFKYSYRVDKALILLSSGDLTPKHKCQKCHGKGYNLFCPAGEDTKKTENYKPKACECVVSQLEFDDIEKMYLTVKEANEKKQAADNAGTNAQDMAESPSPKKRTGRKAKPKSETKNPTGTSGPEPENPEVNLQVKKLRKNRKSDKGEDSTN